jgi:hypothetical protein
MFNCVFEEFKNILNERINYLSYRHHLFDEIAIEPYLIIFYLFIIKTSTMGEMKMNVYIKLCTHFKTF